MPGGLFGGAQSGSGSGQGATVFNPKFQGAADQALQQLIMPLLALSANAGAGTPAGLNYPIAQQQVNANILDPNRQNLAIGGAQLASDTALGSTAPQAFDSANWLKNLGTMALGNAQTPLNLGWDPRYSQAITDIQNNPYYGTALQGATDAAAMGRTGAGAIEGLAGQMGNAVLPLMESGFDPRAALFNRTEGRLMDQTNAINSMSGVGGTPYGASVGANAMSNFDIDWQNQQLARQAQGAAAAGNAANTAGGLYGAAPGLLSSTSQMPSNVYTGHIGQILNALNQRNQASNQGIAGFGSLLGAGQNALTGANALNLSGLGQQQQFSAAPYNTAAGIGNNSLNALANLTALGNNQFQLPQQEIANLMQYMGLGQSASGLSGQLGNLGFNQTAQGLGGLLSGANSLFGNNGLFGGGGSGGGLLSGLFGGGGTAADFGGGGAALGVADQLGLAGAGGGGLDLAAAAPLALSG